MTETDWIYPKSILLGKRLEDYKAFVYYVYFPSSGKNYIGFKSIFYRSGKESNWRFYKTSSKLVKKRVKDNEKCYFYILKFFEDRDNAYKFEKKLLKFYNCIKDTAFLNQRLGSDYIRHKDSYTEDWKINIKNALKIYYEKENTMHPMKGHTHPSKGKSLPQTAPKKHVSKKSIQITNGEINMWLIKGNKIPDGFRKGITQLKGKSGSSPERMRELNRINTISSRTNYEYNPRECAFCKGVLTYEDRNLKTHRGDCRNLHRSSISKQIRQVQDSVKTSKEARKLNFAKSKGFDSHFSMSVHLTLDLAKGKTYDEVSAKYSVARSTVFNMTKPIREKSGDLEGVECIEQLLKKLENKL